MTPEWLARWGRVAVVVAGAILGALATLTWADRRTAGAEGEIRALERQRADAVRIAHGVTVRLHAAQLRSAATRPAVERTRVEVRVIDASAGVVALQLTPGAAPSIVAVPVEFRPVVAALEAERAHSASLASELQVAYERIAADSVTLARDAEIIATQKRIGRCRIAWLLPCPTRTVAAVGGAIGGVVAAVVVLR